MSYYRLPPKRAFCHSITYKKKNGEDDWGKPIYDEKVINYVWFNLSTKFSRGGNDSSEKAPNASVMMTYKYSGDLPDFALNTPISFNGTDYTIVLSKPLIINGHEIGWRLEVV